MITDYIGGEGSAETPKNDYVIYGWPLIKNDQIRIRTLFIFFDSICIFNDRIRILVEVLVFGPNYSNTEIFAQQTQGGGKYTLYMYKQFYHHLDGEVGFNTVNPSLSTGRIIRCTPWWWIEWRTPPKLWSYWEIQPLCPPDFPRDGWKDGDGFPNTSLVLMEHGYNTSRLDHH